MGRVDRGEGKGGKGRVNGHFFNGKGKGKRRFV